MKTPRTDAEIIEAILGGDEDAFGELVRRYRDHYTRFAVRMLGTHEDADEALQDAWMRAYRALAQCDDRERFGGWMYQIVANVCRTKATRGGRRARRYVDDEIALEQAATGPDADAAALRDEIQYALEQLDVDYREAFVMKYVEELSYEEMAEITGAGVSALKMRVKRACEKLRILMEGVPND
ncbi:MAG: RNA polymerase sigma factor [Gemmatimonadaceae bacterium]